MTEKTRQAEAGRVVAFESLAGKVIVSPAP
jgi:hypothetical protein